MNFDFIFFGIVFLLLAFRCVTFKNVFLNYTILFVSFLIVFGYLVPEFKGQNFSCNIFHIMAFVVLVVIATLFYTEKNFFISIIISVVFYSLVNFSSGYLLSYNVFVFAQLTLMPLGLFSSSYSEYFSQVVLNSFFLTCINSYFEFCEFNYAYINLSFVFSILIFVCLSIFIIHLIKSLYYSRSFYEKKHFDYFVTFDF